MDDENRGRYNRSKLRYPSDLTDEESALSSRSSQSGKRGGNRRTVNVREVVNGLQYVEHRLPVASDPQGLAATLNGVRLFRSVELGRRARPIHAALTGAVVRGLHEASPTAPSSTARASRGAERGGLHRCRAVTIQARRSRQERHVLVDTQGLLMHAIVHFRRHSGPRRAARC